jgi:hypothetical protein
LLAIKSQKEKKASIRMHKFNNESGMPCQHHHVEAQDQKKIGLSYLQFN